jgi:hypothetical protein
MSVVSVLALLDLVDTQNHHSVSGSENVTMGIRVSNAQGSGWF